MNEIKYQVFVSSTYEDLKEERKAVVQAILECNCFPAGMELFQASNENQWNVIKNVIDESDFFLVIIAGRYGSTINDDNGNEVSYTEKEYNYALETKKPILSFIFEDIGKLQKNKTESSQKRNKKLLAFRKKAQSGRIIKYWENKDDLKAKVCLAIMNAKKKETNVRGWIRTDFKPGFDKTAYNIIEEQRDKYEKNKKELEKIIEEKGEIISRKDSEIKELNTERKNNSNYINELREKINRLTERTELWNMLAWINAKYLYFQENNYSIVQDLKEEFCYDAYCSVLFFINSEGLETWIQTTKKALTMKKEFLNLTLSGKKEMINSISTDMDKYILGNDCYVCTSQEFEGLFSVCFFLIYIETASMEQELQKIVKQKKEQVFNLCDTFIAEVWDAEEALSENDY